MSRWPFVSDYNFRDKYLIIDLPNRLSHGITPERLADIFAEMNSESMAIFFNRLADIEKDWIKNGGGGWPFQLQYVTDEEILEAPARQLMELIGEYGPEIKKA